MEVIKRKTEGNIAQAWTIVCDIVCDFKELSKSFETMTSIDKLDLLPEDQKNQFTVQSKMIERAKECLQCLCNSKFSSVHG